MITKCRHKIHPQDTKPGPGHTAPGAWDTDEIAEQTTSPLPNTHQQHSAKEQQHQQPKKQFSGCVFSHIYPPAGNYSTV